MQYDQLPVFRAAYDLIQDVYYASQTVSREFRDTLGEQLKREIVLTMRSIYRASTMPDKLSHIAAAREHIASARTQVRLLSDLRQLPPIHSQNLTSKLDEIAKQLAAWHKAVGAKQNQIPISQEEVLL